jgi:curved DNA-binding protein CbpA
MSINDNSYALLGVPPNATSKELRQAYLQLLVTAHPDKGGSAEGFAAIQKAYATLSDPAERAVYDEHLERKNKSRNSAAPTSSHMPVNPPYTNGASHNNNGVIAYVHGQTNFPPEWPEDHRPGGSAVFAGQPLPSSTRASSNDTSVNSISEKILLRKREGNGSGVLGKTSAAEEDLRKRKKDLAELYTHRAALHFAAGRAHHATFDAEEALRVCPEYTGALELLEKLKTSSLKDKNLSEEEEEG